VQLQREEEERKRAEAKLQAEMLERQKAEAEAAEEAERARNEAEAAKAAEAAKEAEAAKGADVRATGDAITDALFLHQQIIELRQAMESSQQQCMEETDEDLPTNAVPEPPLPAGLKRSITALKDIHKTSSRPRSNKFIPEWAPERCYENPRSIVELLQRQHTDYQECQERIRVSWASLSNADDEVVVSTNSCEPSNMGTENMQPHGTLIEPREKAYFGMTSTMDKLQKSIYPRLAQRKTFLQGTLDDLEIGFEEIRNLRLFDQELTHAIELSLEDRSDSADVPERVTKTALDAFLQWTKDVDPSQVKAKSDEALNKLSDELKTHFSMSPPSECVSYDALAEILKDVKQSCQNEIKFWNDDPLDSLPIQELYICFSCIQSIFMNEISELTMMLKVIEDVSTFIKCRPSLAGRSTEHFNSLRDELTELENEWDDYDVALRKHLRARKRDSAKIEEAEQDLTAAKAQVVAKSQQTLLEHRRLSALNHKHFPEMALFDPSADLLHINDLPGVTQCFFEAFDETSDISTKGTHRVLITALQGDPCVLKEFSCDEKDLKKFQKEARRMLALDHPAIMKLRAVVHSIKDESKVYLQMPYLMGGTISEWLEKHAPISMDKLRDLCYQVLTGVEYMHNEGIIHCDIKLDNILMSNDTTEAKPVLSDFDISRTMEGQTGLNSMTDTGAVVGTIMYMAPEIKPPQLGGSGERPTKASDIFALGFTFVEIVQQSLQKAEVGSPAHFMEREIPEGLPPQFHTLLVSMLAKSAAKRPSATELLKDSFLATESRLMEVQAERNRVEEEQAALKTKIEAEREEQRQKAAMELAALQRECIICFSAYNLHNGAECCNDPAHFLCTECFSDHVISESNADMDLLDKRNASIQCPMQRGGLGCDSRFFTDVEVAQCATEEAFASYTTGKMKLMEQKLTRDIEAAERARYQAEMEKFQKLSAEQREIQMAKLEIENLLNLKCPRCKAVFADFNGCMALTCNRAGCGSGFCAWCLKDCGNDAHEHLRHCPEKPPGQDSFFGDVAVWKRVHQQRMRREIQAFLNKKHEIREQILATCRQQLVDNGLGDMAPAATVNGIDLDAEIAAQLGQEPD